MFRGATTPLATDAIAVGLPPLSRSILSALPACEGDIEKIPTSATNIDKLLNRDIPMTDNRRLRCTSSTSLPLALLHTHKIRQRPEFYGKLRMIQSATSLCNLQHLLDNLRCQLSLAAHGRRLKLYYSQEEERCLLTPCSCLIELRALDFENTLQGRCGRAKERKRNHKAFDDRVVLHHSGDLIVLFVHVPLDTCKVPPTTTLSFPAPSWCIVEVPGVFFVSWGLRGLECNINHIHLLRI